MIFSKDTATFSLHATLGEGEQTAHYQCVFQACPSPLCGCKSVTVEFIPDAGGTTQVLCLDLEQEIVESDKYAPHEQDLLDWARLLAAQLNDADYELLCQYFLSYKHQATNTAKLDELQVEFEGERIELEAAMVNYHAVFPFGETQIVNIGNNAYVLVDYFCLKKRCDCTGVSLDLRSMNTVFADELDKPPVLNVYIDYKKGTWERTDVPCCGTLDIAQTKNAVLEQNPNFYQIIQKHHKQLRQLYAAYFKRNLAAKPAALPAKPGRNEACPCGSGKKYKKCCGAA